jgi:hypothetical protein
MNGEIVAFENWCQGTWGATTRSPSQLLAGGTPQIQDHLDFDNVSHYLKAHIAEKLILESCSRIRSLVESGDVTWYICKFGREVQGGSIGFTGRRIQPLKAALLLTAHSQFSSALSVHAGDFDHILAGGQAMAAMYLLAQLEFVFRVKGRYLNEDGTIKHTIPVSLGKKVKLRANSRRVNRIEQAFCLYLYRNRTLAGKRLSALDRKVSIANRLRKIRHPVMHGELPDPSVEAKFMGLLVAMLYYGA